MQRELPGRRRQLREAVVDPLRQSTLERRVPRVLRQLGRRRGQSIEEMLDRRARSVRRLREAHAGGTELARDRMLKPEDVARAIALAAAGPASTSLDEIVLMPPDGVL